MVFLTEGIPSLSRSDLTLGLNTQMPSMKPRNIPSNFSADIHPSSFLKMISRGSNNVTVVNYSERFSVTGMTGTFSELVQYGLSLTANDTESHQDLKLRKRQVVAAIAPAIVPAKDLYDVPYPEQSKGLTKYAPMGKRPATTITAKSGPPQFPTSAYSIARTFLPVPTWQTTLTASRTWTDSLIENPVSFIAARDGLR